MSEIIEGEAMEIPERAVVVRQQPGQALVTVTDNINGATEMVATATRLADALRDIVERQRLYALISGKKFPQVEAWMTIARMDNVVAREAQPPIRHDDGSYEGFAELIRLSDGMVIGRASALCGTPDDKPWASRSEPARRSMAVTRATSRAFRQQYSWIMALAGYEPTPAEDMPRDDDRGHDDGSLVGIAEAGDKMTSDFLLRQIPPDGSALGFRLRGDRGGILVECRGALAEQLFSIRDAVIGQRVTVRGAVSDRTFTPAGKAPVTYQVLAAQRVRVPAVGDLPSDTTPATVEASRPESDGFSPDEQAAIDEALGVTVG